MKKQHKKQKRAAKKAANAKKRKGRKGLLSKSIRKRLDSQDADKWLEILKNEIEKRR